MMNFFRCGLVAAFIFLTTTPAMAATAAELTACKTESEPAGCFAGLKQACDTNDETCVNNIELARACWQAEDAVAKIAAAEAKAKQLAEELAAVKAAPAPAPAAPAPMPAAAPAAVPVYSVLELTAPETMDPPLRAYIYPPLSPTEWEACWECAVVKLDTAKAYVVYGERPGPVPVFVAEGILAPTIHGNFDQNSHLDATEIGIGASAVPRGTMFLYLRGRNGVLSTFRVQAVSDVDRKGYWIVVGESQQSISGDIKGPQNDLSVRDLL
jgi:hypothetical protein